MIPTSQPVPHEFWTPQVIVAVITACITIPITLTTALIAWLQFHTAHTRLRLDLYTKRYAIFDAVNSYIVVIASKDAKTIADAGPKLYGHIQEARFIFGADIRKYLDDLTRAAIMGKTDAWLEAFQVPADAAGTMRLNQMSGRLQEAQELFTPYLDFTFIRKLQITEEQKEMMKAAAWAITRYAAIRV